METYSVENLKEEKIIGEFKFNFFNLNISYPLHDTIQELKLWLDGIKYPDSQFLVDDKLYIRHEDLYVSIEQLRKRKGYIIHYGSGVKHVTNQEMKKIYPYSNLEEKTY